MSELVSDEVRVLVSRHIDAQSWGSTQIKPATNSVRPFGVGSLAYVPGIGGVYRLGVVIKHTQVRTTIAYTTPSSRGRIYVKATKDPYVGIYA